MLTRSVPVHSGNTVVTAEAMLVEISGGLTGMLIWLEPMDTGTVTETRPAPTVTTPGVVPGWLLARAASARQLPMNMTPKATPPRTNAQNAATAKAGGPERPGLGTLMGRGTGPWAATVDYRQCLRQTLSTASNGPSPFRDGCDCLASDLFWYVVVDAAGAHAFGQHPPLAAAGAFFVQ